MSPSLGLYCRVQPEELFRALISTDGIAEHHLEYINEQFECSVDLLLNFIEKGFLHGGDFLGSHDGSYEDDEEDEDKELHEIKIELQVPKWLTVIDGEVQPAYGEGVFVYGEDEMWFGIPASADTVIGNFKDIGNMCQEFAIIANEIGLSYMEEDEGIVCKIPHPAPQLPEREPYPEDMLPSLRTMTQHLFPKLKAKKRSPPPKEHSEPSEPSEPSSEPSGKRRQL